MIGPLRNKTKNTILAQKVKLAHSYLGRLKGLMGSTDLPDNETIWLRPCNSIHTFFMRFAIDVVFVDQGLFVKSVRTGIGPWRIILPVRQAESVFEFKSGVLGKNSVEVGDQLDVGR